MIRGTVTQVCTTVEQSNRLISLGIDLSTSDCHHWESEGKVYTYIGEYPKLDGQRLLETTPAWSLHRLIKMLPYYISLAKGDNRYISICKDSVHYVTFDNDENREITFNDEIVGANIYDNIIDCIEWLIKEEHFNKEYLI